MSNVDNPQELTVLSLCAGYGGLELGLSRALDNPLRVVAVEIEAFALANLEAKAAQNLLAIDALWPDLRTFPAKRFRGCFDFVIGGYPCQPFSCAGKRQGEDDPRHLWLDIERIVRATQPVWCFFENVAGHLSLGFPSVYRSLRSLGYAVEAGLFTAAECGAPHRRQRLFILAHRKDVANRKNVHRRVQLQSGRQEQTILELGRTSKTLWSAPPGQPQYEWEEPRTVVDDTPSPDRTEDLANTKQGIGQRRAGNRTGRRKRKQTQVTEDNECRDNRHAQPPLGEPVDGPSRGVVRSRVDQLRLLGNGVVPQQAELAFRTLYSLFAGPEPRSS